MQSVTVFQPFYLQCSHLIHRGIFMGDQMGTLGRRELKKLFQWNKSANNYDALRSLVPFVQFKKREKHPWRSLTFSKITCNFNKNNTLQWMFLTFFKFYEWYQIAQSVSIKDCTVESHNGYPLRCSAIREFPN